MATSTLQRQSDMNAPWNSEEETTYDGPLSSRSEWHAFGLGLEAGLRDEVDGPVLDRDDVQRERHYFALGFIAGWFVREWRQ